MNLSYGLVIENSDLVYLSNRIKYNAPKRINAWGQNFYMGIRLMHDLIDKLCGQCPHPFLLLYGIPVAFFSLTHCNSLYNMI